MEFKYSAKGLLPSKKNQIRHKYGGGGYYDVTTRKEVDMMILQLRAKAPRTPLAGPMEIHTEIRTNRHQDADNMHTTALDCIQKAGIIKNDKDVVKGLYERITVKTVDECGVWIKIKLLSDK